MTEFLHHYCSSAVFMSLIQHRKFWMTSLALSNDNAEGTWALNHWLDGLGRSSPQWRTKRRLAESLVFSVLRRNFALGVCFSEEPDLLSQWRGYTANGAGFSISFHRKKLEELASLATIGSKISLTKIAYGVQDHEKISSIESNLFAAFDEDASNGVESDDGYIASNCSYTPTKHTLQKDAVASLFTIKNGSFREEKEWRLHLFDRVEDIKDTTFRESGNLLSPYVALEFPVGAIAGVTIGPTNPTPRNVVEKLLEVNNVKGSVSRSKSSFRTS
jgi:hypothetical protein